MAKFPTHLYYERSLPHYHPPGANLFVTFRLAGSIPAKCLQELQQKIQRAQCLLDSQIDAQSRQVKTDLEQRRLFGLWDQALDQGIDGPRWLAEENIAQIVCNALEYLDGKAYRRIVSCIMPNHVHLVLAPGSDISEEAGLLSRYLHSLKSFTAHEANHALHQVGSFWQHESYDHVVRDQAELGRIVDYVLENPVKAGLVKEQAEWPWSYFNENWAL